MIQLKEFDIILDIKTKEVKYRDPVSGQKLDKIEIIKGDYKSTRLNIFLESGKQPYIIGDSTVEVVFEKYDRTVVVMDKTSEGFIVEENVIKTILSTNITAIAGRQVKGEIVVKGINGEILTSRANFYFRVYRGILTDEVIASTNELPLLSRLIEQVTELDTNLTTKEQQRTVIFDGIVDTANTTKTGLDASIIDGANVNIELNTTIDKANTGKTNLDDSINISTNKKSELDNSVSIASTSKSELDESISEASTIESTLGNIETGTIKLATDANQSLLNEIDVANTTKDRLDVSVQDGIKAKDDLELAIQNGGVIYEDVDMLKGLRIYKGIVEPIDTSFWYDTSDSTGITRV